ncbi:hypothetical protein RCL1_003846 [Eukaryota sp. TZLM3-RCL]
MFLPDTLLRHIVQRVFVPPSRSFIDAVCLGLRTYSSVSSRFRSVFYSVLAQQFINTPIVLTHKSCKLLYVFFHITLKHTTIDTSRVFLDISSFDPSTNWLVFDKSVEQHLESSQFRHFLHLLGPPQVSSLVSHVFIQDDFNPNYLFHNLKQLDVPLFSQVVNHFQFFPASSLQVLSISFSSRDTIHYNFDSNFEQLIDLNVSSRNCSVFISGLLNLIKLQRLTTRSNVRVVSELPKSLVFLEFNEEIALNQSNLIGLDYLGLIGQSVDFFNQIKIDLFKLNKLHFFHLSSGSELNLKGLSRLVDVSFIHCPSVISINLIDCVNIERLKLSQCKSLTTIGGINFLPKLKSLIVSAIPNAVAHFSELNSIIFDCVIHSGDYWTYWQRDHLSRAFFDSITTVSNLTLHDYHFKNFDLIPNFINLRDLKLTIGVTKLFNLDRFINLEKLSLIKCQGLKQISTKICPKLKFLSIIWPCTTFNDTSFLKEMPLITELILVGSTIKQLKEISNCKNLQSILIDSCSNLIDFSILNELPILKVIKLGREQFSRSKVSRLQSNPLIFRHEEFAIDYSISTPEFELKLPL